MTTKGDRIRFVRNLHRLSQEKFAEALSSDGARITRGAVGNWELGKGIKQENLEQIAEKFDVSLDWLSKAKGNPPAHSPVGADPMDDKRPSSGIMEIDVRAGLGAGGTTEGREVRHDGDYADPVKPESWRFPTRFMREEVRAPENRVIILETEGDSMAPTILSGDRVIVDTGHRLPTPDGIYAVRDRYGSIVIKRLQVMRRGDPPVIRVISDNKSHDPEDVGADEIAIVGRVLWSLKRL